MLLRRYDDVLTERVVSLEEFSLCRRGYDALLLHLYQAHEEQECDESEVRGGDFQNQLALSLDAAPPGPSDQINAFRRRCHMAMSPAPMGIQKAMNRNSSVATTTVADGTPRLV